ncbi:MAG: sulfite exporter TauE/SafE family protein [Pseudomonadales bacterium]
MDLNILYTLAGFSVGVLVGLTGIGGGALMTPLLILVFKVPVLVAVSTDLLYAAVTKGAGVVNYAKRGLVKWPVVGLMLTGSLPGSWLMINQLEHFEALEALINTVLGISLLLTAAAVLLRGRILAWVDRLPPAATSANAARWRALATVMMGLLLGALVTLSSVGAGALGTALLIICYPRMAMRSVVGTDLVHAVVLTGFASYGHYSLGNIDFSLLFWLLLGSLPGVSIGSYYGAKLSSTLMQPVIATMLLGIGGYFIFAA